ncbi:hypothetical protein ACKC9G_18470 [Pokkaliibacter sp. CJK22405]|uniref:hypothetical protein n=1 Tax=Pokkaliibacter sp. CJK22405 TaxID=3384615 RepID=UPI0039854CEF
MADFDELWAQCAEQVESEFFGESVQFMSLPGQPVIETPVTRGYQEGYEGSPGMQVYSMSIRAPLLPGLSRKGSVRYAGKTLQILSIDPAGSYLEIVVG